MKSVQCFADFFDKSRLRIFYSRLEKSYYRYRENPGKDPPDPPAFVFFAA
jgi:hypothetical protein